MSLWPTVPLLFRLEAPTSGRRGPGVVRFALEAWEKPLKQKSAVVDFVVNLTTLYFKEGTSNDYRATITDEKIEYG